jgi:hypothetical protein
MARFRPPISPGGNANLVARMLANTVKHAHTPDTAWSLLVTAQMLALLPSTQVITLVVGGTASNGAYQLTLTGGGLAAPVVVSSTRDAAETSAQMAAELEGAIATARAGGLAGIVTDESVASATITIVALTKQPNVAPLSVAVSFPGAATGTLTYTYVTTLDPTVEGVPDWFEHSERKGCFVNRRAAFAGATAVTAIMGDAADDNGLLTSTSLTTTGIVQTTGAAEYTPRYEAAFVPQVQITLASATPLSNAALTAGEAVFELHGSPIPQVP